MIKKTLKQTQFSNYITDQIDLIQRETRVLQPHAPSHYDQGFHCELKTIKIYCVMFYGIKGHGEAGIRRVF